MYTIINTTKALAIWQILLHNRILLLVTTMYMWKQTLKSFGQVCAIVGSICAPGFFVAVVSAAPTYTSPSYGVDEVFMGAGGVNDASSASYRARASLGDTAVGNSSSTNFQANSGFVTSPDPYIELIASSGNIDLGFLSTSTTATTTATFSVRTYLASGYNVVIGSDAPKVTGTPGTHTLFTNSTQTAAYAPGTEQFGMNLVANTAPTTFGADPVQLPDASYSYGQVDAAYATPNQYKFVKNDRIAYSDKSSGLTNYTISYIFNISDLTPAGEYVFDQIIVATSTF